MVNGHCPQGSQPRRLKKASSNHCNEVFSFYLTFLGKLVIIAGIYMKTFRKLFGGKKPLIGMVHLLATAGYEGYPGLEEFVSHAVRGAQALEDGGADAVLVENNFDQPHTILISKEQEESILHAAEAIKQNVSIPVGINALLNDWKASLNIAKAIGAQFIRIDVFVDRVTCTQGDIEPDAKEIIAYQKEIGAENVALLTDIHVKHKTMLDINKTLEMSAQEAIDNGTSAIILTGDFTGDEAPIEDLKKIKKLFPEAVVLAGGGINADNAFEQLSVADGAIVGSYLKNGSGMIDRENVKNLATIFKQV